jgi:hypothetical protein
MNPQNINLKQYQAKMNELFDVVNCLDSQLNATKENENNSLNHKMLRQYFDTIARIKCFGRILEMASDENSSLTLSDACDIYDAMFDDLMDDNDCDASS